MSPVSTANNSTGSSSLQIFSSLDTNEDGTVSPEEMAAALSETGDAFEGLPELPTKPAGATLATLTASAMLEIGAADAADLTTWSLQDAMNAYYEAEVD